MGQTIDGAWSGKLTMQGYEGYFHYDLVIEEDNGTINGRSTSMTSDQSIVVDFQIAGSRQGQELVLQELEQLTDSPPEWCLKYLNLSLVSRNDSLLLIGTWKGGVCNPGTIYLFKTNGISSITTSTSTTFSRYGKWIGHLDQSDRPYGFYYEIDLKSNGEGTSHIVSEGSGGEASHRFRWTLDSLQKVLHLKEIKVLEKTVADWKWCIKSMNLKMEQDKVGYGLTGAWNGHIENDFTPAGKCAPGKVKLFKPILTDTIRELISKKQSNYELDLNRRVKIERVIEVNRPQLKIGVWDNGVLDGDIMTLYINGKKVMDKYRVTKRRAYIKVELEEKNNF
ncbi:MAG: hypothetical protein AAF242_21335, partial [Bacteroidota bacterium]